MKKIFPFALMLATCFTACKKDPVTNTSVTKKIKKTTITESYSGDKRVDYYYYDNNDNLTNVCSLISDTINNPLRIDTTGIVNINYNNNLPSTLTIKDYSQWQLTSVLINTFNRHYTFNSQNQIISDSLISFNLQYPFTGPYSYKDTMYQLTNSQYTYSGTAQYKNTYNSPLLNKPYTWTVDTNYFSNDCITQTKSVLYYYGNTTNTIINNTYTNYINPLYIGLLPFLGQSKYLLNTSIEPGLINTGTLSYQYFFDSNNNLIKSIETNTNSIAGSSSSIQTTYYEYY